MDEQRIDEELSNDPQEIEVTEFDENELEDVSGGLPTLDDNMNCNCVNNC